MAMRPLYFLLPGTTQTFFCGGLFAELKTMALMGQWFCEAKVSQNVHVTYRQREPDFLLPGTTQTFFCGGLFAELKTMALMGQISSPIASGSPTLSFGDILRAGQPSAGHFCGQLGL
jgi:hypothetical protein